MVDELFDGDRVSRLCENSIVEAARLKRTCARLGMYRGEGHDLISFAFASDRPVLGVEVRCRDQRAHKLQRFWA